MKNEGGFKNFEAKKGPRSDSNAVEEMDNIVPLAMTQEEEDEEERLSDKGGIEVGEKLVPVKKHGMIVEMKKIPGEIKRASSEAASRDLNPEEAMIASEEDTDEYEPSVLDQTKVTEAQKDIEKLRAERRNEENAAGWIPKVETEDDEELFIPKHPANEGMRKAVAGYEGRKIDLRKSGPKRGNPTLEQAKLIKKEKKLKREKELEERSQEAR